jgi:uncharacterized protein YndB with AHSA1/START domain
VTVTGKHERSIHIDAPADRVFHYLEDPAHIIAAMAENHHATPGTVTRTADGAVDRYECHFHEAGRRRTTVLTREEHVPHRRIVDRADAGPVHIFTLEPDDSGTTLRYGWDAPRFLKVLDALFAHSDRDCERALRIYKREIEALR